MRKQRIKRFCWHQDELGDYWTADLLKRRKVIGIVGNYYDLDEEGKRPGREEQERGVQERYENVGS